MHPIYDVAVYAHGAVAIVGAVTALFAATIAIVQTDIKRVLAYSTMSQIGYMFLAVGIGAYSAGMFHLLSHAFFKALLFLAAGNIIHAMKDEQDMRKFGGLWRDMRPTAITFLVGSLSLVGVIPFVGYFSKEQILGLAFSRPDAAGTQVLWVVGAVTALITGFYTGRMWWLSFWGKPSQQRPVEHPHAPRLVMMVPVAILAILAVIGGLAMSPTSTFLDPVVGKTPWEETTVAVGVGVLTMLAGAALFAGALRIRPWSAYAPWAQRLLEHKYYFDEIYDAVFVRPMDWVAGFALRDVEKPVIDGVVIDTGALTQASASGLSLTQSGYFRNYVLVFVGGAVIVAVILIVRASS
jgi:NADH-quinone oxidoreductase subunit L